MLKLSAKNSKPNHGFTIVELLIVVVIIAILATISIVAYNGITARAKQSSADSSAKQVATKIMSYEVENGSFPSALTDVGITNTGDTSYQYSFNNTVNPKTWCATVTVGDKSSFTSNTQTSAKSGGCPGHGQGGQEAITNLATNPSAEVPGGWWSNNGSTNPVSDDTTVKRSGSKSRVSYPVSAGVQILSIYAAGARDGDGIPITKGGTYIMSVYFRAEVANVGRLFGSYRKDGVWSTAIYGGTVTGSTSAWTRASITMTVPEGADRIRGGPIVSSASGSVPAGTKAWTDDFMMTEGATVYDYADGNSPNWVWNGSPNNSTSTGPAL